MKVDAALVRRLREERAWPQEQLASVTGLSLRTIQRVEGDGSASAETRMALAAAFGIDVARLGMTAPTPPANDTASAPAADALPPTAGSPRLTRGQYRVLRFWVIAGLLVLLDVYERGSVTWSKWVLLFGAVLLVLRLVKTHLVEPGPAPRR